MATEQAISAKGPTDTPKRLRAVLPLLKQLLDNHRQIDYAKLRDRICPSAVCRSSSMTTTRSDYFQLASKASAF